VPSKLLLSCKFSSFCIKTNYLLQYLHKIIKYVYFVRFDAIEDGNMETFEFSGIGPIFTTFPIIAFFKLGIQFMLGFLIHIEVNMTRDNIM
jgi:hypothetical protein